jgi:hypothetical protein
VGGGLALEIKSFLGAVKWHRAVREWSFFRIYIANWEKNLFWELFLK